MLLCDIDYMCDIFSWAYVRSYNTQVCSTINDLQIEKGCVFLIFYYPIIDTVVSDKKNLLIYYKLFNLIKNTCYNVWFKLIPTKKYNYVMLW